MPRGQTFDPAKRVRIRELRDQGLSLTAVAAELGTSPATISKYARLDGVSFDRSQTRQATAARVVDLAALRATVATKMLTRANEFLDSMDKPFLAFNFGGKDNTYEEHLLERPPTGDIRNLMVSAAVAVQRSIELTRFDSDQGAAKAGNLIDALAAGIEAAAAVLDDQPTVTDSP